MSSTAPRKLAIFALVAGGLTAAIATVGIVAGQSSAEPVQPAVTVAVVAPDRITDPDELTPLCAEAFAPIADLIVSYPGGPGTVPTVRMDALGADLELVPENCDLREQFFINGTTLLPWTALTSDGS